MVEGSMVAVGVGARADEDWVSNLEGGLRRNFAVIKHSM